ncbi:MAG: hypothetical protein JWR35_336, partial [Marmoricola sp.]|nr:hypothetical protein [Marmoricola sp.]
MRCDYLGSSSAAAGEKDELLAWPIRRIADVDDDEALLSEIPLNLMTFSEAQRR